MGSLISILVMSSSIQFTALTVVSFIFILVTPYTKVEESFGIQAIHDFIYMGIPKGASIVSNEWSHWLLLIHKKFQELQWAQSSNVTFGPHLPIQSLFGHNVSYTRWDHEEFPGVVSRSFIGPFIVALLTFPWSFIPLVAQDKFYLQIASRINLAFLVMSGFNSFANAVGKKFGSTTRRALIVLTLTQFHFLYYSSRPLPNTFAMVLWFFAISRWLLKKWKSFIFLIALTVIVFRVETCICFGCILAYEIFFTKELSLWKVLKIGVPSGIFSLLLTVGFDSVMWGEWLWPEGHALYFNVYLNKSHEWGVQPFLWYFYSALPRSLLLSLIFVPFCTKKAMKMFFLTSIAYLFIYSFLPHKELRFIMYIIPVLNTCAANTVALMVEKFEGTKPSPESWLGNIIMNKIFGYDVPSDEEADAADKEREQKEKEEEEALLKKLSPSSPPTQYDALVPPASQSSSLRRRGGKHVGKNGVEAQLDEQYSKITAAVLEKHHGIDVLKNKMNCSTDSDSDEPASLSCIFIIIFILMGVHIWCNVGCTVYASLASWNNYPGGESIAYVNGYIESNDIEKHNLKPNEVGVYVSNLAAQTGVTRFLQLDWVNYDKSPSFELVANRSQIHTAAAKKILKKFNRNLIHDFGQFKVSYLILEKVDVPFLQKFCISSGSLTSKAGKSATPQSTKGVAAAIDNVICNFGEKVKNCKIMKVINGFNGIDLGFSSKNVVIKTTPVLWVFRCEK